MQVLRRMADLCYEREQNIRTENQGLRFLGQLIGPGNGDRKNLIVQNKKEISIFKKLFSVRRVPLNGENVIDYE